jgi:hypothetical protein
MMYLTPANNFSIALCCIVVGLAVLPIPLMSSIAYASREIGTSEGKREFSRAEFFEGVAVTLGSSNMKAACAGFDGSTFNIKKITKEKHTHWNLSAREKSGVLIVTPISRRPNKIFWQRFGQNQHGKIIENLISGRKSVIFYVEGNSDFFGLVCPVDNQFWINRNIGAQLALASLTRLANKPLRRSRQTDGENSESDSENRNENCADSHNFFVGFVNNTPALIQSDFERGVRGGAFIFGGLIRLGGFALIFWRVTR